MALKDTEYTYISARIKAKEGQTTYSERVKAYSECKSLSELCTLVLSGTEVAIGDERASLEKYFDSMVKNAFLLIQQDAPEAKYFDFLLYEYDACNLKTLIKCMLRGISADGLLYEYSSVPVKELHSALEKRNFEGVLPKNMADSALEAIEAYSKTNDARMIDFIIDRACFADMLENSRLCASRLCERLVRLRIDSINIVTFQRILKSDIADKSSTLEMAFIENGTIPRSLFMKAYEREDYTLIDALDGSPLKDVVRGLGTEFSFANLEKALDEKYLTVANEEKYVPFGAEVICLYLTNTLFEAKNARIIIAGLASGLPENKIKERVRLL